jgi:type IV pilus assembly protein PilC
MASYAYVAVDPRGLEMRGTLEVSDQSEALRRIKEMGLFPTRLFEKANRRHSRVIRSPSKGAGFSLSLPFLRGRVKSSCLSAFTRQLATLIDAGMPLLRGLRLLAEQEENRALKRIISGIALDIEGGGSLADAMSSHPKAFDKLYVNMVKAGEISGALETTLTRLAEFLEKAQRIKGKVKAAMIYPCAVLVVAAAILLLLMAYVVPTFKEVFNGLLGGAPLPTFTLMVFRLSEAIRSHFLASSTALATVTGVFLLCLRTSWGRRALDRFKLGVPVLGPVFRKVAISRFSRTLGTLVGNGVPILQALNIVKETAGNVIVGRVISTLHDNVKQGDAIAPTLKAAGIFPAMVSGMVDVGEQTGALPELLLKVADNYDDEVDNAVNGMTSLLEPIMIVILAMVVGSIVIALFLPLIYINSKGFGGPGQEN